MPLTKRLIFNNLIESSHYNYVFNSPRDAIKRIKPIKVLCMLKSDLFQA